MHMFEHQTKGVEFIKKNKGVGAFYFDMGTGKTLTALKSYEYIKETQNKNLQLLVVCPISLIESAWGEDIKKFTPFTYSNLRNKPDLSKDIWLMNYEMLLTKKFRDLSNMIIRRNPMCVLDESQKIKSYNAKTTKALLFLAPSFPYRIVMSATPAPNIQSEYWSQMCFLSPTILGDNFFKFRNRYMALIRGSTAVPLHGLGKREMMMMLQRGYVMGMLPGAIKELHNRMKPYCQFISKRDILDLPEEINVNRFVDMTGVQSKAYKDMWDDLVMEIQGHEISVNLALAKIMKVRQVTGGFAYVGDINNHAAIEIGENPKIKELQEIVEEIGQKSIVVFCQYQWEIERIVGMYPDRARALYGETKDKDSVIAWFKGRGDGILVSHPASGGVGLSFNECDYMVFYSLSYSFMEYYQARGRIMRAEKKNNATYIHIIARDSIDEVIMGALQRKEDSHNLFRRIMK
jgi:SNF2 family DNA or RNA helicase